MLKKQKQNKFFNYLTYGLIIISIFLFFFVVIGSKKIIAALAISLFIAVNMIAANYKRFLKLPIEIEFITVGIVITTIVYGLPAGIVVAVLGGILSFVVGFNISPFSFPMLLGYISIVAVSFFLRDWNLTSVGIISAIVNNAIVFTMYHFIFGYDLFKNLSFSISNIVINGILFYNIAPFVMGLIT